MVLVFFGGEEFVQLLEIFWAFYVGRLLPTVSVHHCDFCAVRREHTAIRYYGTY